MPTQRHSINVLVALFSAALATLFLIACQQSQPPTATSTQAELKPATTEIFVTFEGPWGLVPDPKDANSILAIAPKTKSHRPLAVVPANTELDAGVYDLAIPARAAAGAPSFDKQILRANIDPQVVQRALNRRAERYVIRLPKPEGYVAETRYPSRIGATYPPDASTEQNYATAVSLRYSVTSRTGFQLAGTQDAGGAFNPLLLELNVPVIRFTIDPVEVHLHDDDCSTHAREAFRDLVRLLGVTLYVDFPKTPPDCHKKDPQISASEKAQLLHALPVNLIARLSGEDRGLMQEAGILAGFSPHLASQRMAHAVQAAFYLFHSEGGGCYAPIIVGGP